MASYRRLFRQFFLRELRRNYLGSISGFLWPLLQPLALLAVYSYVFVVIFQARVPEADTTGFVPYLAIGFWPWTAFSESLMRGVKAIEGNASLISKVALPHTLLVESAVAATFALQIAGYAVVLLALAAMGTPIQWQALPAAIGMLALLFAFTLGLSYILSALQVFVRDLEQAMRPIMLLWFFATPVLYSLTLVPEDWRWLAWANPMTWYLTTLREMLLYGDWAPRATDLAAVAGTIVLLLIGRYLFGRLSRRFEDFL